ncbi:MAG: hypothetical protein ABEJ31_03995 [Haloarculaceae archaeon]
MANQDSAETAEAREAAAVEAGILGAVGTLTIAALSGFLVLAGVGALYLVSRAYMQLSTGLAAAVVLVGCLLIAGGLYGLYRA